MNKAWIREKELYDRAFGRFMSKVNFVPEEWFNVTDLIEYIKLKKENNK